MNRLEKIWDRAPHNAFTDLARFRGAWYCVFRESDNHMGGRGRVRILRSESGREWSASWLIARRGTDLRDPKLSVTPEGKLMLLAGGTRSNGGRSLGRRPLVAFSDDGRTWSKLQPILAEGDWLWRVTWHGNVAFGITYRLRSPRVWTITLMASRDGVDYEEVCDLRVSGKPNESTVRFRADGTAVALVRREGGDKRGWVGTSPAPYLRWSWSSLSQRLGGPNFLVLPNGEMWAATRVIQGTEARTAVGRLTERSFHPSVELPSGGDCSYAGMVWYRRHLWMSYYSSHEGKACVYLAIIRPDSAAPG